MTTNGEHYELERQAMVDRGHRWSRAKLAERPVEEWEALDWLINSAILALEVMQVDRFAGLALIRSIEPFLAEAGVP